MITSDVMLFYVSTVVSVNILLISAQSNGTSATPGPCPSNTCLSDAVIIACSCLVAVLLGFVLGIIARCSMEHRRRSEHNLPVQERTTGSRSNERIGTPPGTRQYVDATQMSGPGSTVATMKYGVPIQRSDQVVEKKLNSAPSEHKESSPAPPEYVYSYSTTPGDQYTSIDNAKFPSAEFTTGPDGYLTPITKNTKPNKK